MSEKTTKGLNIKDHELTRFIGVLVLEFQIGAGITPLQRENPVEVLGITR